MYSVDELLRPQSLPEALAALDEGVKPLAGGTDVLVAARHDKTQNLRLMSLSALPELRGITKLANGDIAIGAMTTFTQLAEHPLVAAELPLLKTAALAMGGPQIQNVATVGGNICNGATSADSAPGLLALGTLLELHSAAGQRSVPLGEFYAGPGRVKKEPGELLVRLLLPVGALEQKGRWSGVYLKASTRKAMDIATLGVAAVCALASDGTVAHAALALGVAAPTPVRCPAAEALLLGQAPSEALLEAAGRAALESANPRSSWRASKEYRTALIQNLSTRALRQAIEAAGGTIQ